MELAYVRIREKARQIAFRLPIPDFYKDFSWANGLSRQFFETDPIVRHLRTYVADRLEDDLGHGLSHAIKVTLDAGTLMVVECTRNRYADDIIARRVIVVQCAGLLHDIKRKQKDHGVKGAEYAQKILKDYPLSADEVADICHSHLYAVSAHTKILMDRCQSLWVRKNWIDEVDPDNRKAVRKGLFISVAPPLRKKTF